MLILAFDTSGFAGSAALLQGNQLLAQRHLNQARRSAQTLTPAIAEMLQAQGVSSNEVGLVATTMGPGSFTGLRVGVTTAKTWAYATGGAVIGLSTLAVIANQVPAELRSAATEIHAVLDAQRKELFLARFAASGELLAADTIVAIEPWLAGLAAGTVVTGSGLARIRDRLPSTVAITPQVSWEPQAAVVGQLAWQEFQRGRRDDLWKLAPVYLRQSYAEEKRAPATV